MTTDKEYPGVQAQVRFPKPLRSVSEGINRQSMPYSLWGLGTTHPGKMLPSLFQGEAGVG